MGPDLKSRLKVLGCPRQGRQIILRSVRSSLKKRVFSADHLNRAQNEVPRPNSGAPHFGLRLPHKSQSLPHLHVGLPHKINRTSWLPHFGLKLPHIVTTYPIPASSLPHVTRAGVWYPILEKRLWVLPHSANLSVHLKNEAHSSYFSSFSIPWLWVTVYVARRRCRLLGAAAPDRLHSWRR